MAKKMLVVIVVLSMVCAMSVVSFAADTTVPVENYNEQITPYAEGDPNGLTTFIDSIKGALADMSSANLATILVAALGITVGLALAWFAYRWITRKVQKALKRGGL